jgi:hypothetical protein
MVGGKEAEYSFRIGPFNQESCKPRGGGSVARRRLADNIDAHLVTELLANRPVEQIVRDNPKIRRVRQRRETIRGLLDHAPLAVEHQDLFGFGPAASWPKACAAASGQDDRVERWISFHISLGELGEEIFHSGQALVDYVVRNRVGEANVLARAECLTGYADHMSFVEQAGS